ncbi:trypsin-like peptidase domain-containing protein [Nocardia sp. NPDC050175]|uniref:trypsin-like peptidase domain-containing protein n=1 Tax=Nocardia sp. NPDC050175 TaxID=3364317 RepID=UPI0037941F39
MTDLLDTLPFDWARPEAGELLDILARTYYRANPVIRFTTKAGISPADIDWEQPMAQVWHELLTTARNQNRIRELLDAASRDTAIAQRVRELIGPAPIIEAPVDAAAEPQWHGFDDSGELEAQLFDEPSLLDVAFLARGFALTPAVCRMLVTNRTGGRRVGTAFRIGPDLLLTNHHVLFDHKPPGMPAVIAAEAWFHYELGLDGLPRTHDRVACAPETIVGDPRHDWAVIRVGQPLPEDIPMIELDAAATVGINDRVNIIQHPSGERKKIGVHHNLVRHVDDDVIQYWTDTESGSSGSPVFDNEWRLVALHHRHVKERGRNQGIRISRVIAGLEAAGLR